MTRFFASICICITCAYSGIGQVTLQSGPMVGYSTAREVPIWVQTYDDSEVFVVYWPEYNASEKYQSTTEITSGEKHHTAKIVLKDLEPGTVYYYEVYLDGILQDYDYECKFSTSPIWKWRGDAPDFDFVVGSCTYVNDTSYDRPGKPYGSNYGIFEKIHALSPDFMVWLGDNTYLREADWTSESGIYYRHSHTRALEELQPLLASTHHYAIWDDHDYGPNDSDRSYSMKQVTRKAFNEFWANPVSIFGEDQEITSFFTWNDVDFFLLDNRWNRSAPGPDGTILGAKQLQWLKDALHFSKASFKMVCIGGQVVSDAAVFENFANYIKEREEIIGFIDSLKIENVVFLTGDRHHSEVSKLTTPGGIHIYDITSSALTSGTGLHLEEPNQHRVEGSMIGVNNFAHIAVSGSLESRQMDVVFYDSDGNSLFDYQIKYQE